MPGGATTRGSLRDRDDRYGWVSIALHWFVAVAVIALWIIGKGIPGSPSEAVDERRALHMSVGITAWLLIAVRIVWRVRAGHPRVRGLRDATHRIAKTVHYALLVALTLMLFSGPLLSWAAGHAIPVFDWFSIPGPLPESVALEGIAHAIHIASANALLWLTLLHVGGAFKHLMFHADDVFARMLWPGSAGGRE